MTNYAITPVTRTESVQDLVCTPKNVRAGALAISGASGAHYALRSFHARAWTRPFAPFQEVLFAVQGIEAAHSLDTCLAARYADRLRALGAIERDW